MRTQLLSALSVFFAANAAFANPGQTVIGAPIALPLVEVGGGYTYSVTEVTNPCRGDCSGYVADSRASSGMITIGVTAVRLADIIAGGTGEFDVRFLPLYMIVDAEAPGYTDSFGRAVGVGSVTHVRRFVGALVQGEYNPSATGGILALRGRLVTVDYNRDLGTVDWRALDASVGVRGVFGEPGNLMANLEITAGAGFGGVHLNNLEEVAAAIHATGVQNHSWTANPFVAARAGLRVGGFRVELSGRAEHRADLTAATGGNAMYMTRPLTVDSDRVSTSLDAEFVFLGGPNGFDSPAPGPALGVFVNGTYEYDTLTFTNMFTGSGDDFHQFRIVAGLRGRIY